MTSSTDFESHPIHDDITFETSQKEAKHFQYPELSEVNILWGDAIPSSATTFGLPLATYTPERTRTKQRTKLNSQNPMLTLPNENLNQGRSDAHNPLTHDLGSIKLLM